MDIWGYDWKMDENDNRPTMWDMAVSENRNGDRVLRPNLDTLEKKYTFLLVSIYPHSVKKSCIKLITQLPIQGFPRLNKRYHCVELRENLQEAHIAAEQY